MARAKTHSQLWLSGCVGLDLDAEHGGRLRIEFDSELLQVRLKGRRLGVVAVDSDIPCAFDRAGGRRKATEIGAPLHRLFGRRDVRVIGHSC